MSLSPIAIAITAGSIAIQDQVVNHSLSLKADRKSLLVKSLTDAAITTAVLPTLLSIVPVSLAVCDRGYQCATLPFLIPLLAARTIGAIAGKYMTEHTAVSKEFGEAPITWHQTKQLALVAATVLIATQIFWGIEALSRLG